MNAGNKCRISVNIILLFLLFLISAMLTGCSKNNLTEKKTGENGNQEPYQYEEKTLVSLDADDMVICGFWKEEDGIIYVFVEKGKTPKKANYQIYQVKDGQLCSGTKYDKSLMTCYEKSLSKKPIDNYSFRAIYGQDHNIYLIGSQKGIGKEYIRRLYKLSDCDTYENIPVQIDFKKADIVDIQVGAGGRVFVDMDNDYGIEAYNPKTRNLVMSTGDIYGYRDMQMVVGRRSLFQYLNGIVYIWNIGIDGRFVDWVKCDTLSTSNNPSFADAKDNLYIAGSNGISYLAQGSSLWEILIDGSYHAFDNSQYEISQLFVDEDRYYLLIKNRKSEGQELVEYSLDDSSDK